MFDCNKSYDECSCDCHENSNIKHFMACCGQCPSCFKRYRNLTEKHIAECKTEKLEFLEKILCRALTDEEKKSL